MRVPITLDLHLPNFNYPDTPPEKVFDKLIEIATTAEANGFSSVSLMDHLHQIFMVGPPQNYMFDGNTMLAAIAARTEKLTLGTLVGGVTYRNPALLAKITTTLDIISGGRAWCGIGAAWFEGEHLAYGYDFPSLGTRFEYMEEALQILRAMFTQEQATVRGEHFHVEDAYNNPKPLRGDIPILIGGSGEKKTLRMVAQYGDGCNLFGDADRLRHLLGVLEGHCERLGRDMSEITKTAMGTVVIAPTMEGAQQKLEVLKAAGLPPERIPMITLGDPDTIGEAAEKLKEAGAEGMTLSLPDVHDLETLALVGQTLGPIFA
jgi:F420-dependent oxidoreductase-like protein